MTSCANSSSRLHSSNHALCWTLRPREQNGAEVVPPGKCREREHKPTLCAHPSYPHGGAEKYAPIHREGKGESETARQTFPHHSRLFSNLSRPARASKRAHPVIGNSNKLFREKKRRKGRMPANRFPFGWNTSSGRLLLAEHSWKFPCDPAGSDSNGYGQTVIKERRANAKIYPSRLSTTPHPHQQLTAGKGKDSRFTRCSFP